MKELLKGVPENSLEWQGFNRLLESNIRRTSSQKEYKMKKNDIFELEITDMGVDGEGIGHFDGMTFFVKDALIGDVIRTRCHLCSAKRQSAYYRTF